MQGLIQMTSKPPKTAAERQAARRTRGINPGLITDPEAIAALRALQARGMTMREAIEKALKGALP